MLDGRTVERIRQDCPIHGLKSRACAVTRSTSYVDPETFLPRAEPRAGLAYGQGPGASCTAAVLVQRLPDVRVPAREPTDNLALTDIRAQHPDAIER